MSLEEELAELSTVYHGQRERMAALEQLLKDASVLLGQYHDMIENLTGPSYAVREPRLPVIEAWQRRANALLRVPDAGA